MMEMKGIIEVKCENCNRMFKMSRRKLRGRKLEGGLIELYFSCPSCKSEFHVALINQEIIKMQSELDRKLREIVKLGNNNKPISQNLIDRVNYLRKEIKAKMDKLNGR